jgi:hypothetical protein
MRRSKFHLLLVLSCTVLVMLAYVGFMRWRHPGGDLSNNFMYVLPIIVPFVAFLFDRAEQFSAATLLELILDSGVVFTSIMRAIGDVPFVSGHALFLSYAIARPGSRLTKFAAAAVMIQVLYLKFYVWHDLISPITGTVLGLVAAMIIRRQTTKRLIAQPNT